MDNSIGVGAIVGLAFASSIYVWKSESFGVLQKTILYICIIFPPAQWLGILIMLIYNNIKVENSAEKVSERKVEQVKTKLDSSINSLTELRDKGILTDVEYYEKVAKIKTEKAKEDIQNSSEYRQLKSLRDSGILTTEEFNLKVEQISKNELKSLLKKDKLTIINDGEWDIFKFDDESIRFSTSFIDRHNSFTHGNYKAWFLIFEAGHNYKFYTKNSNGKFFIYDNIQTTFFDSKEELLYHLMKLK